MFVADYSDQVFELPGGSTTQTTLPFSGLQQPAGVAVDRSGDVFITDSRHDPDLELPAGASTQMTLPFNGLSEPIDETQLRRLQGRHRLHRQARNSQPCARAWLPARPSRESARYEAAFRDNDRFCFVAATAVSTRPPLVARSSHDFHVDNPLGGCRKRTQAATGSAAKTWPEFVETSSRRPAARPALGGFPSAWVTSHAGDTRRRCRIG